MKSASNPVSVVPVRVRVRASALAPHDALDDVWRDALQRALSNYSAQLLADLELPVTVIPSIEVVPDDEVPRAWPFVLSIGAKSARLDLQHPRVALTEHLPLEIYRNRALFVVPAVASAIVASIWAPAAVTEVSVEQMLALLRAAVQRNLSVTRLRAALAGRTPEALGEIWALIDGAHREDGLSLMVALRIDEMPDQAAHASARATVQKRLFERLGVLCPPPIAQPTFDLDAGERELRLNDVRLPVCEADARAPFGAPFEARLLAEPQLVLTRDGIERLLDVLRDDAAQSVDAALQQIDLTMLCRVLEAWVGEGLSLAQLPRLLDALTFARVTHRVDPAKYVVFASAAEIPVWKDTDNGGWTVDDHLQALRRALQPELTQRYATRKDDATLELRAHRLDAALEKRLADRRPWSAQERAQLVEALLAAQPRCDVVVTGEDVRARLQRLVQPELPALAVLAQSELLPSCRLISAGAPIALAPASTPPAAAVGAP